jgi:hypothetical protein
VALVSQELAAKTGLQKDTTASLPKDGSHGIQQEAGQGKEGRMRQPAEEGRPKVEHKARMVEKGGIGQPGEDGRQRKEQEAGKVEVGRVEQPCEDVSTDSSTSDSESSSGTEDSEDVNVLSPTSHN